MIEEEADVRSWLEAVEAPPPRLDVDVIVQIGRARVRRRRQLAAGGSAAVALAVAAAVPVTLRVWPDPSVPYLAADQYPALDCTITELEIPDGEINLNWVNVAAMDPTGRYIVGNQADIDARYATTGETERIDPAVILWDRYSGEPMDLTAVLGGAAQAVDVNSDGVVVGIAWGELNGGWVYHNGDLSELAEPPGFSISRVRGLNEAGDVVGMVEPQDGSGDESVRETVAVWPAADPDQPRILTEPAGKDVAEVAGITDLGVVVGSLHGEPGEQSPFLPYAWEPDGTGHYLPLPDSAVGGQVLEVAGDWATGSADLLVPEESVRVPSPASPTAEPVSPSPGAAYPSPGADGMVLATVPARWNLRTGTAEAVGTELVLGEASENGLAVAALAIAADGDLVVDAGRAQVHRDGEWYSLPDPDDTPMPAAMSQDGTIIAGNTGLEFWFENSSTGATTTVSTYRPVVWHC